MRTHAPCLLPYYRSHTGNRCNIDAPDFPTGQAEKINEPLTMVYEWLRLLVVLSYPQVVAHPNPTRGIVCLI
jgi:hypothetical protein